MKDLKIIVDNDIFTYYDSDSIFTKLYIDYQNNYFPNNQWTDITNSVLNMWTYTLLKNKNYNNVKFKLYFMDGPFRMDVFKDKDMNLIINCINARKEKEILEYTIICSYYDFLDALYCSIKSFSYLLYFNKMNKDRFKGVYDQAIISMKELKQIIKNKTN